MDRPENLSLRDKIEWIIKELRKLKRGGGGSSSETNPGLSAVAYNKTETDFLIQQLEKKTSSGYQGDLLKTDAAPTTKGFYALLETGIYPNLGNINAEAGKLNFASFDGTTWSKVAVDIPNFVAPIDALNSTSTTSPLSANQGKVLNDGKLNKGTYTGTASDLNTKIEKVETDYFEPKKNYFNVNSPNILVGKYLDSNGTVQNNAAYNVTDFIEIPDDLVAGYKLYSSQNGVAVDMRFVNFYDANKVNMAASYSSGGKSIAIPSGAKYIRITHLATYTNFQLEFGLAVTAYEPFTLILRNEKFILKSLPNDIVENSDIKNKAISANKTDFISSTNLFNKDSNNVTNSYFLTNTEVLQANATYLISEYISVKSGDILSKSHAYGGGAYSNFYDINKVFISASNTQTVTAPQDGFIRVSVRISEKDIYMLNIGSSALPFSPYKLKLESKYLPESADSLFVQSKMGKPSLRVTQASLADGGIILNTYFPYHLKKGLSMSFYADISSFAGSISFGKGWQEYRGEYFTIDSTNIYLRKFDSVETTTLTVVHGLTLSKFIKFAFTVGNDGIAKVTLSTLGGVFTANMQGTNEWNFKAFLRTAGQALSNITMTCASKDFQNSVWAFGDSYFGIATNRHNYYLKEWGYFNFLLNGLAGQGGAGAYSDLLRCLNFGTPKYILWFLGMNDSDASYLSNLNSLTAYCESKGITLVIATIPTTPTQNKETIKSYVLASGLRYVDFYKAMGTNSSGVWYSGYLNSDNVHPDAPGAKALASQVLVDFPEIMQY